MTRACGLAMFCAAAECVGGTSALTQSVPDRRVAVTFDDLPGAPAAARMHEAGAASGR